MGTLLKKINCFLFLLGTLNAQYVNTDWKVHDIGNIFQVQTNLWGQGYCHVMSIGPRNKPMTSYPKGSRNQYTRWDENNGVEPIIGARVNSPNSTPRVSSGGHENGYDFYATSEPWDTIWVVNRNEIVDIPTGKFFNVILKQNKAPFGIEYVGEFDYTDLEGNILRTGIMKWAFVK